MEDGDATKDVAAELDDNVVGRTAHALEKLGLEFATSTNPKLEKLGLKRFARYEAELPPIPYQEDVHILDEHERARIKALSRHVVMWAFFVGACSGLASSIASFLLAGPEGEVTTFGEDLLEFGIVNGVTIVATMIEVAIIYRVALRTVLLIARETGTALTPQPDDPSADERRAVALALCRAAAELPNPPDNPFGIDPYREISKWRLVFTTILYKLKITLTNFILRLLIRRIGGRIIIKAYLTFTDVFVTGAWDAYTAWRMVREARIRAIGPSACEALIADILRGEGAVRREVFITMQRAVASCIVRGREVHPNLMAMLRGLVRRSGQAQVPDLDDTGVFLEALAALTPHERELVLEVLVLSTFPDGSVSRAEVRLLEAILGEYGRTVDRRALRKLCRDFVRGDAVHRADLQKVIAKPSEEAGR